MSPDVSVVVISYNDAARLPRAIRSVQRQTLRSLEIIVVDDASTDATADIVRRLAQDDPRIRYECLAENSGGCSAPRNRGIDLATAPWVMFCDSDDEYERHACKNLLEAAERTGADVVCGTAERVDTRTGRVRRWREEVHADLQVAEGLADLPDLLYDTISVNKIYRTALLRENGLRFPEGLLFEDQLFTLEAMAAARRLAVIPQVVYRWHVDRLSEEPSITQRRNEARNVESRIEINRRIDAFLSSRGLDRIQQVKDLKFLRHDLYLYLSSMLEVDDETAAVLIDRLVPYVEQVNLQPAWQLRPALRVAIYHLLLRDLEGIRSAMRFVKWASVVDVRVVERDGRQRWGCSHLDDGEPAAGIPATEWLDIDELGLLDVPFTQRRYLHRLTSLSVHDGRIVATGSTVDYDGSLGQVPTVELRYLIGGDRTVVSVPAAWTGPTASAGPGAPRVRRRTCWGVRSRRRTAGPWDWRSSTATTSTSPACGPRSPRSPPPRLTSPAASAGPARTPSTCCLTTTAPWGGVRRGPVACARGSRPCAGGGSGCRDRPASRRSPRSPGAMPWSPPWPGWAASSRRGGSPCSRWTVADPSTATCEPSATDWPARDRSGRWRGSTGPPRGECPPVPSPSNGRACAPRGCSAAPPSSWATGPPCRSRSRADGRWW